MMDYTYEGKPVAQMATADIHDCLNYGFGLTEHSAPQTPGWEVSVRQRLELELFIRERNLR